MVGLSLEWAVGGKCLRCHLETSQSGRKEVTLFIEAENEHWDLALQKPVKLAR
ncbi:MAG: hypothetical protein QW734_09890 [Candidatus Bathyarchaeia archaeon]